jgi:putative membrane protein
MYIRRSIHPIVVLRLTWKTAVINCLWALAVVVLHELAGVKFLTLPFMTVTTLGIAVAFLVGLKNDSSYDRFWEARKIWGTIIIDSRAFGNHVLSYIHTEKAQDQPEVTAARRELIHRHLAWINALRMQLRKPSRFQPPAKHEEFLAQNWDAELRPYLAAQELQEISRYANPVTQLGRRQGDLLRRCYHRGWLQQYPYVNLMDIIRGFFNSQGKSERIKKTPYPRQFAHFSHVFTYLFLFLLPMGLLDGFEDEASRNLTTALGQLEYTFLLVPVSTLIAWTFATLEQVGNDSEDPFESGPNDVSMTAICRTIEIDLREMLGEDSLPDPIEPVDAILY